MVCALSTAGATRQSDVDTTIHFTDLPVFYATSVYPDLFLHCLPSRNKFFRGTLCLIEWKTSSKPKPLLGDTYDNPLQIVAYLGAVNRSRVLKKQGVRYRVKQCTVKKKKKNWDT